MTTADQDPVLPDPPSPPGSNLEALVDGLDGTPNPESTEPQAAPGTEPPDA